MLGNNSGNVKGCKKTLVVRGSVVRRLFQANDEPPTTLQTADLFFCFYFYLFSGGPIAGSDEVLELGHKFPDILEGQVNRCEADIRDIIERFEAFHYDLSDLAGFQFAVRRVLHVSLDLIDDRLQLPRGDRAFFAGAQQAGHDLVPLEGLALAVLFHDHIRDLVDPLIRCKPPGTLQAFAAAADRIPVLRLARINYLIFKMSAKRAAHRYSNVQCSIGADVQPFNLFNRSILCTGFRLNFKAWRLRLYIFDRMLRRQQTLESVIADISVEEVV